MLTLKQLQLHTKPIVFLNTNGFYDPLVTLFEHFYQQRFAKPESRVLYEVAPDVESAVRHIASYETPAIPVKWHDL